MEDNKKSKESIENVSNIPEKEEITDLLDRQDFVDRVIKIIELQAAQKRTSCFAINGKWGIGKSFVLKMLETQLEKIELEKTTLNKYIVFNYNCWQYDYYTEPLVAIVASMLDTIDAKENLIPNDTKTKIKGFLKAVGSVLLVKANEAIEKKTGLNPQEIIDVITEAKDSSAEKIESEHNYDSNFIFKATLKQLQETIKDLSQNKTIVFIVDELDRCLPEYAIKILERLHHVFIDIPNVQVILSIDKKQLEHTIKCIFGEGTQADKYLSKFINFEVKLTNGSLNDLFDNRFEYYINNFEFKNSNTTQQDVADFKKHIFDGIDTRSCISIIDKCNLLHSLLFEKCEKKDFSFMCLELAFAVCQYWGVDITFAKKTFDINDMFDAKNIDSFNGLEYINNKLIEDKSMLYFTTEHNFSYVRRSDIWGVILSCYRYVLGYNNDKHTYHDNYKNYGLRNYCIEFRNLLNTIV